MDITVQTISQGSINSIVDGAVIRIFPFREDVNIVVSVDNTALSR